MTRLPTTSIARNGNGWLISCSCGWETWATYRATADVRALDHRKNHNKETN